MVNNSTPFISDLFLRFTYHLYISHQIKYRQFNEMWESNFDNIPDTIETILCSSETTSFLDKEKEMAASKHIRILPFNDAAYPSVLKNYKGMPPVLYCLGNTEIDLNQLHNIAIVGSRKASSYGKKHAFRFATELSSLGFTIVSGLAYGIDAESHKGALSQQGNTIAVVGTGVDVCYPKSNTNLMKSIKQTGCILSEFPIGTAPKPYHFPARNRIISGISMVVILMEAAIKSGAMITADLAIDQGKEVFAVPGSIDSPTSQGTNELLKQGVRVLTQIEDITSLPCCPACKSPTPSQQEHLDPVEKSVIEQLQDNDLDFSSLCEKLQIPSSELMKTLTMLEIRGVIRKDKNVYSLYRSGLF
ncbi:MAG: DNA-processing protein DprA [Caldisericia bacterium]|nr:DNA-processing protein DprA [Caldisericia bacterium]